MRIVLNRRALAAAVGVLAKDNASDISFEIEENPLPTTVEVVVTGSGSSARVQLRCVEEHLEFGCLTAE